MDDLLCRGEVVHQTLRELEFINRWLGGNAVTLEVVRTLARNHEKEELSIADLGCGGGDMLKLVAAWGRKNKITLTLTGIDANPHIIEFARDNCRAYPEIKFETLDILSPEFQQRRYDIVMGTLFYHHFDSDTLPNILATLCRRVRLGMVFNDIHRHWLAYYSIRLLTRLFSRSAMVRFDAPLSVLRAFRRQELTDIFAKAGLQDYQMKWRWAFRWQVLIRNHAL